MTDIFELRYMFIYFVENRRIDSKKIYKEIISAQYPDTNFS